MSRLYCRFSHCNWTGSEKTIFRHVELNHKKYLCEPTGMQRRDTGIVYYYDFVLSDLQQETFALSSTEGLYWFCQNPLKDFFSNALVFGVFYIGQSECKEYTLKLGLKRDQDCEYWGPFRTQPELNPSDRHKEVFELGFHFQQLERLNQEMTSRKLRLYFGDFDDSDDVKWPSSADWDRMDIDERLNSVCWEKLVCSVCSAFICRDARFCENKHFVCLNCFDSMQHRNILKCPICRGVYLYDCSDDKLECWLRLLKWPETPRYKNDSGGS